VLLKVQPEGGWVVGFAAGLGESLQPMPLEPVPQSRLKELNAARLVPMREHRAGEPLRGRWILRPSKNTASRVPVVYQELAQLHPEALGATQQWLLQSLLEGDNELILESELYGPLSRAERVASRLDNPIGRALRDLPNISELMAQQPPTDPVLHLGWVLAQCEVLGPPRSMDVACWRRHLNVAGQTAQLLTLELNQLMAAHAALPIDHPINKRLRQLAAVHLGR
jgi:hypothetical protein